MTPHEMLIEVSKEIGLPTAFHRDLYYWDRLTLEKERWSHFVWMVRETGTVLMPMNGGCLSGHDTPCSAWYLDRNQPHRYFWYFQGVLRELTLEEARRIFAGDESRFRLWAEVKDRPRYLEEAVV